MTTTTDTTKALTSTEFRDQLKKIMPGYKWTVHKKLDQDSLLSATGTQSAGLNRISTLFIKQCTMPHDGSLGFEAKISGFGLRTPYICPCSGKTIANAFRELQNELENMASLYSGNAMRLRAGRAWGKRE